MRITHLTYHFIFDPAETWAHLYEFEGSLASFFDAHGLEAVIPEGYDENSKEKFVFIQKRTSLEIPPTEKVEEKDGKPER